MHSENSFIICTFLSCLSGFKSPEWLAVSLCNPSNMVRVHIGVSSCQPCAEFLCRLRDHCAHSSKHTICTASFPVFGASFSQTHSSLWTSELFKDKPTHCLWFVSESAPCLQWGSRKTPTLKSLAQLGVSNYFSHLFIFCKQACFPKSQIISLRKETTGKDSKNN